MEAVALWLEGQWEAVKARLALDPQDTEAAAAVEAAHRGSVATLRGAVQEMEVN